MNEQEAIEFIKNSDTLRVTNKKAIEAVRLSLEALEKQVAKKPVDVIARINGKYGKFPSCNCNVLRMSYCERCGQKLDWSDEE